MIDPDLDRRIAFLVRMDELKRVERRTVLMDGLRPENDAEHSWHLAIAAMVLAPYARDGKLDLLRVLEMVIIHDAIEVITGDTFLYDPARAAAHDKEAAAARQLFGMLPHEQAVAFIALWEEFETGDTPEARFARALDRLQPQLQNYFSNGIMWQKHGVTAEMVLEKNRGILDGSVTLWEFALKLVNDAVAQGFLARGTVTATPT